MFQASFGVVSCGFGAVSGSFEVFWRCFGLFYAVLRVFQAGFGMFPGGLGAVSGSFRCFGGVSGLFGLF